MYSFGIVLYELITREEPYAGMRQPPLEIAYFVAENGLRPKIPDFCPEDYATLMMDCWKSVQSERPSFSDILERLRNIKREDGAIDGLSGLVHRSQSTPHLSRH